MTKIHPIRRRTARYFRIGRVKLRKLIDENNSDLISDISSSMTLNELFDH